MRVIITGMKFFYGDIDGKSFDSTTAFVQTKVDDRRETGRGYATQEYNIGTSEVYKKFLHIQFPANFDVDFDTLTSGKKVSQVITAIREIKQEKAA